MSHDLPPVTARIERTPAHPSITAEQISDLVDTFYGHVQDDARLGPIFAQHVDGDWAPHLDKMKSFWRSVLLKSGEYKGRPVPAHVKMTEVTTQDFQTWLALFKATVDNVFEQDARPIVMEVAERIASSLWLAMNMSKDPFAKPPVWSERKQ